jgi:prepilin-type N-terminal cleavage/methylation domain-containing protein
MTTRRRILPARSGGFTLIELMIALTVLGVVLVAVFSTFFRSQKVGQIMSTSVNLRQGIRGANQLLERELRMAGSGWRRLAVDRYRSGGGTDSLFAINFGPGGSAQCDSVNILGGWTAATTLRAGMATPSSGLPVNSTTGFAVGDMVVVTDGNSSAHMFQVTAVQASPAFLTDASSSTYNPPTGVTLANWPSGGYVTGTQVYRASQVTYKMDSTTFRKPALTRREFGGTPQLVAYEVSKFQVLYRMQDGTTTRSPSDLDMVDEIVPIIWTSQRIPGRTAISDSVWAAVRPRTF